MKYPNTVIGLIADVLDDLVQRKEKASHLAIVPTRRIMTDFCDRCPSAAEAIQEALELIDKLQSVGPNSDRLERAASLAVTIREIESQLPQLVDNKTRGRLTFGKIRPSPRSKEAAASRARG